MSIALMQVIACNTAKKLLYEIRQKINSLSQAKVITRKVHNKIKNSIKV